MVIYGTLGGGRLKIKVGRMGEYITLTVHAIKFFDYSQVI